MEIRTNGLPYLCLKCSGEGRFKGTMAGRKRAPRKNRIKDSELLEEPYQPIKKTARQRRIIELKKSRVPYKNSQQIYYDIFNCERDYYPNIELRTVGYTGLSPATTEKFKHETLCPSKWEGIFVQPQTIEQDLQIIRNLTEKQTAV